MRDQSFDAFWNKIKAILVATPSSATVFNLYKDFNPDVEPPEGPSIRLENLRSYYQTWMGMASVLVVGEAAGPWGTRFSGIPFTGERQLIDPLFPITGSRSSKGTPRCSLTKEPPFVSRSAEIFWEVMLPYHPHFIAWDAFPLHTHKIDNRFSVRNPRKKEVEAFAKVISLITDHLQPKCIVSVGRKAHQQLEALRVPSIYVRHRSMGGKTRFASGIRQIFEPLFAGGGKQMSPVREVPKLVQDLYEVVGRLEELFPGRPFTLDGHLVGSIGEVVAAHRYGLRLLPCSSECHDASAECGTLVQIKATQGTSVWLRQQPSHLIVLKLLKSGLCDEVYNGPGALAWNAAGKMQRNGQRQISLSVLNKLMASVPCECRILSKPIAI